MNNAFPEGATGREAALAEVHKAHLKQLKEARKEARKDRVLSANAQAQIDADFKCGSHRYEAFAKFNSHHEAIVALRKCCPEGDWFTSKTGVQGSNRVRSYHGSHSLGAFMIISPDKTGIGKTYIYAKDSNPGTHHPAVGGEDITDSEGSGEEGESPRRAARAPCACG